MVNPRSTQRIARQPAGWRSWLLLLGLTFTLLQPLLAHAQCTATETKTGISMSVRDGQLTSAPFQIFVDTRVTSANTPRLLLRALHAITETLSGEEMALAPSFVAPGQTIVATVGGHDVTLCGTVLLFDLRSYPIEWYKPMRRVEPILHWNAQENAAETGVAGLSVLAIGPRVNIGQPVQAWLWTLAVILALVALIGTMTRPLGWLRNASRNLLRRLLRRPGAPDTAALTPTSALGEPLYCLLCSPEGHLSLSKVQLALWTLAIGAAIFFYGLIRVEVPSVPTTLVILMGLSLVTGGVSYLASDGPSAAATQPQPPVPAPTAPARPSLSDLIRDFPDGKPAELSISRAQMLFWTVLLITLFVWKSALEGSLWDVPEQLVALTGMSQLGYLAPKFDLEKKDIGRAPG